MNLTSTQSARASEVAAAPDLASSRERVAALITQTIQDEAEAVLRRADPDVARRAHSDPLRTRTWALLCLRIATEIGAHGLAEVTLLRRDGATWAEIGTTVRITRQSAHERWNTDVTRILDRYGDHQLGGPVAST